MDDTYLVYIADVYCPWCYGFSAIITRLAQTHPELKLKVYGGHLMSQPVDLQVYASQDSDLISFWEDVERHVGLSLGGAINAVLSGKHIRMYSPGANLLYVTLKNLKPGHELEQFIMLEHMFYERGEDIFSASAINEMGRKWEIDPHALINAAETPQLESATERNMDTASELMDGIESYPTLLLVRGDKIDAVSRGYVHFETVEQRLENAMRDLGVAAEIDQYCTWHGNCAFGKKRAK